MNWSKAKTILIIVFLIADIFLFYVSFGNDIINTGEEDIAKVLEYLKSHNITIKGTIPGKGNPASLLYVKYKVFGIEEAKEVFFNSDDNIIVKESEEKVLLENDVILLELHSNGEIFYLDKRLNNKGNIAADEGKVSKNIESFLRLLNINLDEAVMIKKDAKDNYIKLKYIQSYKNRFLDKTYVEIKALDDGISYAKVLWFESVENGKTKNEVISPIKALLKLSELYGDENAEVIVDEVTQGYYFSYSMEKTFEVRSVIEGNAIPVWRITTNVGNVYINGYNGTVEEN
ncbi:MAG: hypothetical protein GX154_06080 [Clostridiales bacterium]|nr:hypothetical protein [Clostridiales bacterium]